MKIIIAPDKFKGCLSAGEVARAIAVGLRRARADIEIDECPVADGGEGTVVALVAATGGRLEKRRVVGPLPDMKVDAAFGILGSTKLTTGGSTGLTTGASTGLTTGGSTGLTTGGSTGLTTGGSAEFATGGAGLTAVVEMSAASGLALLEPRDRNPMRTTSYGTGQLLLEAAKLGVTHIILGIGGSATVDGGIGCLQACGQPVILDEIGPADMHEPLVGDDLQRVVLIKHARGSPLDRIKITVASDVNNPLTGPNGAARIFGPQKGATPGQVEELDQLLRRLAERCGKTVEANMPGAGAAGGLGFAMIAFFDATLRGGFNIVADAVRLRDRLISEDLCITGEGRLDASSLGGKASIGVARLCKELKVSCAAIVGSVAAEVENDRSLFAAIKMLQTAGMSLDDAMHNAAELIAERAATLLKQ